MIDRTELLRAAWDGVVVLDPAGTITYRGFNAKSADIAFASPGSTWRMMTATEAKELLEELSR